MMLGMFVPLSRNQVGLQVSYNYPAIPEEI